GHPFPVFAKVIPVSGEIIVRVELDDIFPVCPSFAQDSRDVLEHLSGLYLDVARPDDVAAIVHCHLTADKDQVTDSPAMRERHRNTPVPVVPGHDTLPCCGHDPQLLAARVFTRARPPLMSGKYRVLTTTESGSAGQPR